VTPKLRHWYLHPLFASLRNYPRMGGAVPAWGVAWLSAEDSSGCSPFGVPRSAALVHTEVRSRSPAQKASCVRSRNLRCF
jgi:hypothetical protein